MAKISLSDSSIKSSIDELAKDIECQVLKKLQASNFVNLSDETTDIFHLLQLLVYVFLFFLSP